MRKPRFFAPGAKQVSASMLNTVVRNQRTGDGIQVAGSLKKTVLHGQVVITTRRARADARQPFEPWISDITARKVKVNVGRVLLNSFIFVGVDFALGDAEITLASTAGDYWLCLKVTTAGDGYGTVELDASTTVPEDRGWADWDTDRFIPLAMVTVADSVIRGLERLHFGGDVTVYEDYPGTIKLFHGTGYGLNNKGEFTGYINLPPGWRPADGSGTPSLPNFTGRFPIMIDPADTATPLNGMDATGGAATHTHTIGLQTDYGNAGSGSQVPADTTAAASSYPPYVVSLYIVKI